MSIFTTAHSTFFHNSKNPLIKLFRDNGWIIPCELNPSDEEHVNQKHGIDDIFAAYNITYNGIKVTNIIELMEHLFKAGMHPNQFLYQLEPYIESKALLADTQLIPDLIEDGFLPKTYQIKKLSDAPIESIDFTYDEDEEAIFVEHKHKHIILTPIAATLDPQPIVINETPSVKLRLHDNNQQSLAEARLGLNTRHAIDKNKADKLILIENRSIAAKAFNLVFRPSYNQKKHRLSSPKINLDDNVVASLWKPDLMVAEFFGLDTINKEQGPELTNWEIIRNNFFGWQSHATGKKRIFNGVKIALYTILVFPLALFAGMVLLRCLQNFFRVFAEFIPKVAELYCKRGAAKMKEISSQSKGAKFIFSTLAYALLKGAEWILKLLHYIGRAVISPQYGILLSYQAGRRYGRKKAIKGMNNHAGRSMGLGLAIVSLITSVVFGLMAWPLLVKTFLGGFTSFVPGFISSTKAGQAVVNWLTNVGTTVQKAFNFINYTPVIQAVELGSQFIFGTVIVPLLAIGDKIWTVIMKKINWYPPKPQWVPMDDMAAAVPATTEAKATPVSERQLFPSRSPFKVRSRSPSVMSSSTDSRVASSLASSLSPSLSPSPSPSPSQSPPRRRIAGTNLSVTAESPQAPAATVTASASASISTTSTTDATTTSISFLDRRLQSAPTSPTHGKSTTPKENRRNSLR